MESSVRGARSEPNTAYWASGAVSSPSSVVSVVRTKVTGATGLSAAW